MSTRDNDPMKKDYIGGNPREECGIFGIFGHPESAVYTYLGLYALQHRGQESAGIASCLSDGSMRFHRAMGTAAEVFDERELRRLKGDAAIGHVRYSTTGASRLLNAQPIYVEFSKGRLAIAHNGNLTNAHHIRKELEAWGSIFTTTTDSEVMVHLMAMSPEKRPEDFIGDALRRCAGSFSLVALTPDRLVAVRDPRGIRPLCLGTREWTDDRGEVHRAWLVSSESCSFDVMDACYERVIVPGKMVVIDSRGLRSLWPFDPRPEAFCVFEYVYFARPDSILRGKSVYDVRKELGRRLAGQLASSGITGDVVIAVPDSSNPAALGLAQASGIPFEFGLIRSHYVGRTFIEPKQQIRDFGAKLKYNPVRSVLKGRRVVCVDDSIVRGTTSKKIVKMLKKAGAAEVHLAISCPPWRYPCYYGIDVSNYMELIVNESSSMEKVREFIGCESLTYLTLENLLEATGLPVDSFCHACFDGSYVIPPEAPVHRAGEPQLFLGLSSASAYKEGEFPEGEG